MLTQRTLRQITKTVPLLRTHSVLQSSYYHTTHLSNQHSNYYSPSNSVYNQSQYTSISPQNISSPRNFGVVIVPQQRAYVIERFGKFSRVLSPGLHILVPFVDRIAYVHTLKESAIPVPGQTAITMDNVTISIDGVLYVKVQDPVLASYGVSDIYYAMVQLAQTTMRSELGKITLDKTFAERESLNKNIVESLNKAALPWGIQCLRYEIKDILPPVSVKNAMDMQAEAERRKRAQILDSEGTRQAEVNIAEGQKQANILAAQGEAAAIITKAQATSKGIHVLAQQIMRTGGREAVSLRVAEQYVSAFGNLAKKGNTILLPSNTGDISSMVASAMTIYQNIQSTHSNNTTQQSDQLDADEQHNEDDSNELLDSYIQNNHDNSHNNTDGQQPNMHNNTSSQPTSYQ